VSAPRHQALAERAHILAQTANQLIADIESDMTAPAEAAFHAKDAYVALNRAHNAMLDAIAEHGREQRDAQQAAAWDAGAQKVTSAKLLAFPETINYTPLHQMEKTRRMADGRFACVAALYFNGLRGAYVTVIAETRGRAIRDASDYINCGQRALTDPSYAARMRSVAERSEHRLRAMGG
jgi:hypothetical protein